MSLVSAFSKKIGRLLCPASLLWAAPAAAQTLGEQLKRFVHDDSVATFHVRSYFLNEVTGTPYNLAAWAGGGWIGYQSGWLYDTLQIGAVGYTTQPLWAPQDTDGTQLLKPQQYGFFTLGQAYASLRWKGQTFTAYRQHLDELEVNPDDDHMVPLLFEAYGLHGTLGPGALGNVRYYAGYVAAIKPKEQSAFVNMAERAGAPNNSAGMGLLTLRYGSIDDFRVRGSFYHVPDILTSSFADIAKTFPVDGDLKFRLWANTMVQGSTGLSLTTAGQNFSTWSAGIRAEVMWKELNVWGAYTQTGSAADYRTPYGGWMGFTSQIVLDFDRANERAFQVGATYDFKGVGLPGLAFRASGTFGSGAIDATAGLPVPQNNEYDLVALYHASSERVPEWLKPLRLRASWTRIDQFYGDGTFNQINDYRLVLNYELKFYGFKLGRDGNLAPHRWRSHDVESPY